MGLLAYLQLLLHASRHLQGQGQLQRHGFAAVWQNMASLGLPSLRDSRFCALSEKRTQVMSLPAACALRAICPEGQQNAGLRRVTVSMQRQAGLATVAAARKSRFSQCMATTRQAPWPQRGTHCPKAREKVPPYMVGGCAPGRPTWRRRIRPRLLAKQRLLRLGHRHQAHRS